MTNEIKPKKETKVYNAHQRAQAVLMVWTEARRPSEVCRQMGISSVLLGQWQERAMEGMLLALQPRIPATEKTVALNSRLAVLLERKSRRGGMKGLERRLARLQGSPVKPGQRQETLGENKD